MIDSKSKALLTAKEQMESARSAGSDFNASFNAALALKSTTNLAEGTNLYFTKARVLGALPSGVPISIIATENLPAFSPVTSQGKRADSANPSASFGRVIGLAVADIANGFSGQVIESGEIINPAWTWTAGDRIFLSGTGLASAPPISGFVQQIGTACGPTKLLMDIGTPTLL